MNNISKKSDDKKASGDVPFESFNIPGCKNLDRVELGRPGGPLLTALLQRADKRGLRITEMARALGVTYSYITQLRSGIRPVKQISNVFSLACAEFLGIPRMLVLIYAGIVTTSDFYESEDMMTSEISRAIEFICNDKKWGHVVTPELREADATTQFGVVKLYEAATCKVLLDKELNWQSLAEEVTKLKALLARQEAANGEVYEQGLKNDEYRNQNNQE